jgi:hypothetical protein
MASVSAAGGLVFAMIPGLGSRQRVFRKKWAPILRHEYAQIVESEHFLTANRIPLCRKMLYRNPL